jgi:PST family polysaccharide transporter
VSETQSSSPATASRHPTRERLDRSLGAGLAWTGLVKGVAQLLSWASTLVVARLLAPTDYGIMGMATVYLGLVQLVSEFGLGAAVIQRTDLDESQIARLGGLSVLFGCGLFCLSVALAPLIAGFFAEPAVRRVIMVLATTFVIAGLHVLPYSLLSRDLAFRRLALIDGIEALAQTLITLGLAIAGARYWALVAGGIFAKALSTTLLLQARPHRIAWPRQLEALRSALKFGWHIVASRITWYWYSNADFVVVGRVLGTGALGAYTFGWTIASIPVDKIMAVLGRVTFPVLSAVQGDRASVARYLLLITEGVTLIVLPASLGLALVAHDFVAVALGTKWLSSVVPLQILSIYVTYRCLITIYGQALVALGETSQAVRANVVQAFIMPAAFLLAASRWGIDGVAVAWLLVQPVVTVPMVLHYTLKRVDLSARDLMRAMWPAVSGGSAMATVVLGIQWALKTAPDPMRLGFTIAAGVLTFAGVLLLFHRDRVTNFIGGVRGLRSAARPSPA